MATRLYFHAATDSTTGLPTTEQSSLTSAFNFSAQTNNLQMTTSIGTSQADITGTTNNANLINTYVGKFVSPSLDQTSVAANTWTYNFSTMQEAIGSNWPVDGSGTVRINCYVWRPSNSTKIGTILDGNTASNLTEPADDVQVVHHTTFTGAAVSSVQTGDVIIFEAWFIIDQSASGSTSPVHFYYDGTTVNTTANATVSNHASFLETPENLTFVGGGTTNVSQTSIQKYNLRHYTAPTTIQKYNLRHFVTQTHIHKYNLRILVAVLTSIQKYNLRAYLSQTTIHKYRMSGIVAQTSIQKYNLRKFLSQTTIQKYNLRRNIAQTLINKYNLRGGIIQTSIHKYRMSGIVLATTIQKYNLRRYISQTSIQKYNLRRFVAVLTSIHKYNLRRFIPQTIIHKYNIRAQVLQTSVHKYNLGPTGPINMTQTNTKTYSNKFIVKT